MKSKNIFRLGVLFFSLFICTGCVNSISDTQQDNSSINTQSNLNNLPEIAEKQVEYVRSTNYVNLEFKRDFTLHIPKVDKLYELELKRSEKPSFSECYQKFDSLFDQYFSTVYTDADKNDLYRFISTDIEETSQDYPFNFPAVSDFYSQLKSGELSYDQIFIDTDQGYLALQETGYIHAINRGNAARRAGKTGIIGMRMPSAYFEEIVEYKDLTSQDVYILNDTSMSVSEIVNKASSLLEQIKSQTELIPTIVKVKVRDLGDGQNGCSMYVTKSYQDVAFDVYDMKEDGAFHWKSTSDDRIYELMPAMAFMMDSQSLDIVVGYDDIYEVTVLNEFDTVIEFDKATQMLSDVFSEQLKLQVSNAELLYALYHKSENNDIMQSEIVWKYTAYSVNEDLTYIIYINAVTGECHYYLY